jgi:hypothetical protein
MTWTVFVALTETSWAHDTITAFASAHARGFAHRHAQSVQWDARRAQHDARRS